MKILVCMKQVPNTKHMTIDPDTNRLVRHGVSSMLNPADRCALERALRFRDQNGGTVTVLSMGGVHAEEDLMSAWLVGADQCILLTDSAFAGSDTFATASVLAAAIKYEEQRTGEGFDLIFCGRETIDGETGQVGSELAELLGYPIFSNISRMDYTGSSFKLEYMMDQTRLLVDACLPLMVTFPLNGDVFLRPSISERLEKMSDAQIPHLNYKDLSPWLKKEEIGLSGSSTHVLKSYVPTARRKGVLIDQGTAAEKAEQLLYHLKADGVFGQEKRSISEKETEEIIMPSSEKRVCVFVEQNLHGKCKDISLELLRPAMDIRRQSGMRVSAVLLGADNEKAEKELAEYPIDEIISCEHKAFADLLLAPYVDALGMIVEKYQPEGILVGSTVLGKELAARIAGRFHTGLTAECTGIRYEEETGLIVWSRPAYGGKLMADIVCKERRPQMGTIREGVFVKPDKNTGNAVVIRVELPETEKNQQILLLEKTVMPTPAMKNTNEISMIVGMGRGIRDMDGFDICCDFADAIGAELGASRGGLELKLVSQQYLLGSNGRTVRPQIYFACGISGALQHMTGVMDSGCIIAINCDPSAPIFTYADYGVVGDLFQILPELEKRMKKRSV